MGERALKARRREIHLQFALYLHRKEQYQRAREEFLASECDPRIVLQLFRNLLPEGVDFAAHTAAVLSDAAETGSSGNTIDKSAINKLLIPYLSHLRSQRAESSGEHAPSPASTLLPSTLVNRDGAAPPVFLDQVVDTVLLTALIFTNAKLENVIRFLMGAPRAPWSARHSWRRARGFFRASRRSGSC